MRGGAASAWYCREDCLAAARRRDPHRRLLARRRRRVRGGLDAAAVRPPASLAHIAGPGLRSLPPLAADGVGTILERGQAGRGGQLGLHHGQHAHRERPRQHGRGLAGAAGADEGARSLLQRSGEAHRTAALSCAGASDARPARPVALRVQIHRQHPYVCGGRGGVARQGLLGADALCEPRKDVVPADARDFGARQPLLVPRRHAARQQLHRPRTPVCRRARQASHARLAITERRRGPKGAAQGQPNHGAAADDS
mmetsp:Transcript_24007/g.77494  ORF Transcript_24007/g.77494 Transcript_24007/m.77494 type:complete len:255 (+) Transcript_24007:468-1232(+)